MEMYRAIMDEKFNVENFIQNHYNDLSQTNRKTFLITMSTHYIDAGNHQNSQDFIAKLQQIAELGPFIPDNEPIPNLAYICFHAALNVIIKKEMEKFGELGIHMKETEKGNIVGEM
jgi:hypothetical protein